MKNFNFKYINLLHAALIIGVVVAGVSKPAGASEKGEYDYKYYSAASLCYSPEQSSFDDSRRMEFGDDGSIENPSQIRELKVVCPIIRDNTLNRGGIEVQIDAEVVNAFVNESVYCRLGSRTVTGNTVYMPDSYQKRKGNRLSHFWLTLPGSEMVNRVAIVQCTLPKMAKPGLAGDGSRIKSIRVRENP